MFEFIKNLFKKKPKPPCPKCKGKGTIWVPTMKVGSMTEYHGYRCDCTPKIKK